MRPTCLLSAFVLAVPAVLAGCANPATSDTEFREQREVTTGTNIPRRKGAPSDAKTVSPEAVQDMMRTGASPKAGSN